MWGEVLDVNCLKLFLMLLTNYSTLFFIAETKCEYNKKPVNSDETQLNKLTVHTKVTTPTETMTKWGKYFRSENPSKQLTQRSFISLHNACVQQTFHVLKTELSRESLICFTFSVQWSFLKVHAAVIESRWKVAQQPELNWCRESCL